MQTHRRFSRLALIGLAAASLAMSGCTTPGAYLAYANAQVEIAKANSASDQARFAAMRDIAQMGDTTTKVTALMSIQSSGKGGQGGAIQLAAPAPEGQGALQLAAITLPVAASIYTIGKQVKLGLRQSDNATTLALGQSRDQAATSAATFAAFGSMASQIQAPAANVSTTTNTTTTTLSGTGVLGSGSYSIGPNSGTNAGNTATPVIVRPEIVRPEIINNTPEVTP